MHQFNLGVMARSRKENERRLPIHPAHFERIDPDLRGASSLNTAMQSISASRTNS